jgi:hypothetical protein
MFITYIYIILYFCEVWKEYMLPRFNAASLLYAILTSTPNGLSLVTFSLLYS